MNPLTVIKTIRTLGPVAVLRRAVNIAKIKSGYIERLDKARPFGVKDLRGRLRDRLKPEGLLDTYRSENRPFFFDLADAHRSKTALSAWNDEQATSSLLGRVERLKAGTVRFFSIRDYDLGRPINWHFDPQAKLQWPADRHWRHYSQFDPALSDIKMVWEASRFAFVFDLVRAYGLTADASWLRLGLDLIDEWIDGNPVGLGVQWACGQETTFRLMAWSWLLHAAVQAGVIDADRFSRIMASIYRQALRIEHYISFARSIRNNHSLSEAAGLFTVGLLYPQFDRSNTWRDKGLAILQAEAAYQIYDDGAYIQHSMNYHRVMLSDCLWAARLADLHDVPVKPAFNSRAARATGFLIEMLDETSGRVPNYGSNDGAHILPLSSCDYCDFRPIVQAAAMQFKHRPAIPAGSHDEILFWLFDRDRPIGQVESRPLQSASFNVGGYDTLRGRNSWGMIRCHSYVDRPAQADMLHFDLWHAGRNVLRDTGSYKYYCSPPWQAHFKATNAHNTIEVAGESQMVKGARFMWFNWTRSRLLGRGDLPDGDGVWWEGEHDGYQKRFGLIHRRRIERREADRWTVVDSLVGNSAVNAVLRWHLPDAPYDFDESALALTLHLADCSMQLSVASQEDAIVGARVIRGDQSEESVEGWESVYYSEKRPIPVLRVDLAGTAPVTVTTQIDFASNNDNP